MSINIDYENIQTLEQAIEIIHKLERGLENCPQSEFRICLNCGEIATEGYICWNCSCDSDVVEETLLEADFRDVHIKVGDMVYFEYKYLDIVDGNIETCFDNYFGKVLSITQKYGIIQPVIQPIADELGRLIEEDDYNELCCPKNVYYRSIEQIYACTSEYFDRMIQFENNNKAARAKAYDSDLKAFCKQSDTKIERFEKLKEMLQGQPI